MVAAVVVGVFSFSFHLHRFVAIFLSFFLTDTINGAVPLNLTLCITHFIDRSIILGEQSISFYLFFSVNFVELQAMSESDRQLLSTI